MNILSIESSTGRLSIAVSRDETLLSETADRSGAKHMVNIMGLMDHALRKANLTLKDMDIFGVNLGPGDFTGTRIGISVVKILSWLDKKPAFGINSLDVFALEICLRNSGFVIRCLSKNIPVMVMPCLDVRRGEVYFAFYDLIPESGSKDGFMAGTEAAGRHYFIKKAGKNFLTHNDSLKDLINRLTKNEILKMPDAGGELKDLKILIGGNCYPVYSRVLTDITRQNSVFRVDKKTIFPRARNINICAYFNAKRMVKAVNLIPVYVREFIPFGNG